MTKIEKAAFAAGAKIATEVRAGKRATLKGLPEMRALAIELGFRDAGPYQQFIRGYGSKIR